MQNQGTSAHTTEAFHAQLERANDGFSVVSEYFGRGIFNKLTIITNEDQDQNIQKKDTPIIPNVPKPVKIEATNHPRTEARLRLEEGVSKQSTYNVRLCNHMIY